MSTTPPEQPEELEQPVPGGATRDYARHSLTPFAPLMTNVPAAERQVSKPPPTGVPVNALMGLAVLTALVVVLGGAGFMYFG